MSEKKSLIIYIIATMAVINLSNCRSFHASSRLPSAPYLLVDTIVLHDPKVIEPSKVLLTYGFSLRIQRLPPKNIQSGNYYTWTMCI